jgi:DNA-binding transcriptional regulator YiaG
VEPGAKKARAGRGRKRRPAARRQIRTKEAAPSQEKARSLTPAKIRSLRRKLGLSQKELAILTGASSGAVVSWEKGKFKPKKDKADRLAGFAKMGKEEVRNLLAEKLPQSGEKKPEDAQIVKAKGKGKGKKEKEAGSTPH